MFYCEISHEGSSITNRIILIIGPIMNLILYSQLARL